jgi:hypothetical protein
VKVVRFNKRFDYERKTRSRLNNFSQTSAPASLHQYHPQNLFKLQSSEHYCNPPGSESKRLRPRSFPVPQGIRTLADVYKLLQLHMWFWRFSAHIVRTLGLDFPSIT